VRDEVPLESATKSPLPGCLSVLIGTVALTASLVNLAGALASSGCILMFSPGALLIAAAGLPLVITLKSRSVIWRRGAFLAALSYITTLLAVVILSLKPIGRPGAYEAQAIGDSRAVVSAQQTWASWNGGFYEGDFECLSTPQRCRPDYPDEAPQFLGKDLTQLGVKSGYVRTFHPGPPAPTREVDDSAGSHVSPTSVQWYAYVATPANRQTGDRSFCTGPTGIICVTKDGSLPGVVNGRCEPCNPLE